MAEQQFTQEEFQSEQQQEPTFPTVPGLGPEPKKKQAAVPAEKPIKEKAKAEPTIGLPPVPKQEGIPFFETPMEKSQREAKVEMAKEPENLSWMTETFRQYKDLDDKYSDFSFEGRMKLNDYRDAFQNKNTQIKRHEKLINNIVNTSTDDFDIEDLTMKDSNGNTFLNKERLRRIVTNKVNARGGNGIVADFVYSKAVKVAEDKFALNKQKVVFDTKLKTANIPKPKDANVVESEFKDIQLSARADMKNAQEAVRMDFISESNKVNDKYAYSINQVMAAAPYSMNKAVEDATTQLTNEKIDTSGQYQFFEEALPQVSNDEIKQRAAEIFEQQNKDYLTTQYMPIIGEMQAEVNKVSKKYNNILNRKRLEIQASYEGKFSNMKAMYDKQAKDYNSAIEKLWNDSGAEVESEYNKRLLESYKNMGMGDVFTKKFTAAAGNIMFGLGTHLRANGMTGSIVDFISGIGQYGSFYNNTYTPSVKDAYLSPKFWAGGVGELLGSSSVIAATTIATRNPYIGALISNIAEGSSMAGAAYENQLARGKDPVEARNAANSVVKMNMLTMPLNFLQAKLFMPFTKGTGFIGGFKRTASGSLGSSVEEMFQSTFEEGSGFNAKRFVAPDTLEMGVSVFGSSMLMGGMSGGVSSLVDNMTKNRKVPSPIAQVGASMARENGPSRIDAVAEGLNVTGEINDEQTRMMKMASEAIISAEQDATRIGLEGDKKDAYVGISYDIKELEAKKEQTQAPEGKAIIDRQIADKKQQLNDILDDKVELASVTIAGAKIVAPVEEVLKMMDTEDFAESLSNQEVTVDSKNADVATKLDAIKQQQAPVRQQNIISDTGEIIGQVPTASAATVEDIERRRKEELDSIPKPNENGWVAIKDGEDTVYKNILKLKEEINAKYDEELTSLQTIKTQEDATKISEGQKQEVGQPSNIVQPEGALQGQPEVGQAEGGIGQATQQAADARNRNLGSQAQQVEATANSLSLKDKSFDELQTVYDKLSESSNEDVKVLSRLVENAQEKKERESILNIPLGNVSNTINEILKKESSFIDKKEATEAKTVADKYSNEVSQQEAKKDFKDAFFGRPENWVADALKMRESTRVIIENGGTFKDLLRSVQKEFEYDGFTEEEAANVIKSKIDAITKKDFRQNQISEAYVKAKADGSNPELVKAVEDLIEAPAPMAEAAPVVAPTVEAPVEAVITPVESMLKANTKIPTNLEKVYNFLDSIEKSITDELNSGKLSDATRVIPLATIKIFVKTLKALVKGGMTLQDALKKVAADNKVSVSDVSDAINTIAGIQKIGADVIVISETQYIKNTIKSQIEAIGKVKDRAKAIQDSVSNVIDDLKNKFGTQFTLSAAAIKRMNKDLFDAVFSKMDDATAIDEIIPKVSSVVEFAIKKQLIAGTAKLLDNVKKNYDKGKYSGAVRLDIRDKLYGADARKWLNSSATLEDISLFNDYLKELTGRAVNTANLNNAIQLADTFVPSPKVSTITKKDSLNNKIKNLAKKLSTGAVDLSDYKTLVRTERAIADIQQKQGELTGLTQEEQDEIMNNYNDLLATLPKPIDQLIEDAKAQIDEDAKSKATALNEAIATSQEFRDSIKNPLLYEGVLRFSKELTDDFINSLSVKDKALLAANIDEIMMGNPNSITYEFSSKAGAFKQSNINYKFGKDIFEKRQLIGERGLTGAFNKVRRAFMDVDFNRASAERMAASFDLFRFHLMDAELNTGVDEFGMGVLESSVFGPLAKAIDSAFNKVAESLGTLQESMKLLNDKSNRAAIKRGIGELNRELGTGFFGGKAKWMHIKKLLGYGNSFYMDISTRMATIVSTQIDHISNLEEGESAVDVVLLRNILDVTPDEYDGRTMKEQYEGNPSSITDMTDDAQMLDHIAYGILTKGGVNKLSDFTKEELLSLLTENQKKAIAKWREHIDNTRNVVEAAMMMKGSVSTFLNEYFPRRVFSKQGVSEIKDIEEYLKGSGTNIGVDSGQIKSRKGEKGRLDLNGNSVLYNNLKDIYLIHEVKPALDAIKGLDDAVAKLKAEKSLGAATYADAISIAITNRAKNSLESNERITNQDYSLWYKIASQVTSAASRVILISQQRQALADYPSNITKLSAAIGFANRTMKNQVSQLVSPKLSSYTTDKGKFVWDDYVKIALTTGSSVHRVMSVYADNFLYEFSKSKEQLQREQRVASWQDMAVKKHAWMSRFEQAFERITGESLDHNAFEDERGAYRAMYYDAVQKASDVADSFVDRQYGLASIARQPLRINIFSPFLGRFLRNVFGKSPTIAKNNPASVILGFLSGYPSVQFQLFSRYMRTALSTDRSITKKQRAEDITRALTEVVAPSILYNTIRATTGILYTTTAAAVMAAGDSEEDRKRLYKQMESEPFWKRWFTKLRIGIGEGEEKLYNACINGMLSSTIDPNVNALIRPAVGFVMFKTWKENAIEEMTQKGMSKKEIADAKQKIRDVENVWFEAYNIRPIELFGTKEYAEGIKRYYPAGAATEGVEDLIKSVGGFGILYNEVSRSMDVAKLIDATDENKNLSETEVYAAASLKLAGLTFANVILGGKAGAALSMFSGDMNKVANMMISDQKSIQTGFEIKQKKSQGKKGKSSKLRGSTLRKSKKRKSGLRS